MTYKELNKWYRDKQVEDKDDAKKPLHKQVFMGTEAADDVI